MKLENESSWFVNSVKLIVDANWFTSTWILFLFTHLSDMYCIDKCNWHKRPSIVDCSELYIESHVGVGCSKLEIFQSNFYSIETVGIEMSRSCHTRMLQIERQNQNICNVPICIESRFAGARDNEQKAYIIEIDNRWLRAEWGHQKWLFCKCRTSYRNRSKANVQCTHNEFRQFGCIGYKNDNK